MTSPSAASDELIRRVVRGDQPWTDLRTLGMDLHPETGQADNVPPTEVKIDIHDLARGFASHRDDPAALRAWAFVMQSLGADFEAVAEDPSGEIILDALWRASFGEPLDEAQERLIEKLARQQRDVP
jgi:hypothetical protein